MFNLTRYNKERLAQSNEMEPVAGSVEVSVPVEQLWHCFTRADLWPRWNRCMFWARNHDLVVGQQLIWAFEPLRWWMLYKLPGIATLVEVEEKRKVTWEVRALPGFFARHTYWMEDLGAGRSRFGSWEQAMGPSFRSLKPFWLAHFEFVKDESLEGARRLEHIYQTRGRLDEQTLGERSWLQPVREALGWMGMMRPEYVEVAPGVHAALHGGGNSLILRDQDEVLLVDPKLPPIAGWVRRWIERKVGAPVTHVVNTHFHFDHTWGNHLYPEATIVAQRRAPELMRARDGGWWRTHPAGMPTESALVDDSTTLMVGEQEVQLHYDGPGHTATDLWLYLERGGKQIVVTGDVASLGIYPFFDLGEGGADISNMIRLLREWADRYPNAIFIPGHGPLASAEDLREHAAYLEFLYTAVADARARGLSEAESVRKIDLSAFNLSVMPIFHYGQVALSEGSNIRGVYRLQERGG